MRRRLPSQDAGRRIAARPTDRTRRRRRLVCPTALAEHLRRAHALPTSLAALLAGSHGFAEFRRIVREVFPDEADVQDILSARGARAVDREPERVWAFMRKVEARFFPTYELEEYEQVACGIPFVRNAWSFDRFHELDLQPGQLMLFALCEQPYADSLGSRVSLLDGVRAHLPAELVAEIPVQGVAPQDLHDRLDGTPLAAAAEFCDWLWGQTGSAFLDIDDEVQICDDEWSREAVLKLAEQWRSAEALLNRVSALGDWLEEDPARNFARLLNAALERDAHTDYQRQRRLYAHEITPEGIVPVCDDGAGAAGEEAKGGAAGEASRAAGRRGRVGGRVPARAAA